MPGMNVGLLAGHYKQHQYGGIISTPGQTSRSTMKGRHLASVTKNCSGLQESTWRNISKAKKKAITKKTLEDI
jgi:hypothetical protein